MSGSIGYSQLLPAPAGAGSISASLLQTIYGTGPSSAASPGDALAALSSAERDQTKDIALVANEPSVARDLAAFKAGLASATSADALLSNPAVLKVLLVANGLGDQVAYPALAKQALLSNTADTSSLADRLPNTAWKSAAQTYQFATQGLSIIRQPSVLQTIANAYAEITWRQSLDAAHPGLSNALTFRSEATKIGSIDQILGDPVLRDVVTTALAIPLEIAFQPLEAQQKAISSKIDIKQFQSAQFVEQFVQRYLIAKAGAATTSSPSSLDALAVSAAGLYA